MQRQESRAYISACGGAVLVNTDYQHLREEATGQWWFSIDSTETSAWLWRKQVGMRAARHPCARLADVSPRVRGVGGNGMANGEEWRSDAKWKPWHILGSFLRQSVWVSVFSPTADNAFFKPTTCGDVVELESLSRYCFNRSFSDIMELRADFMVLCTERKKHSILTSMQIWQIIMADMWNVY